MNTVIKSIPTRVTTYTKPYIDAPAVTNSVKSPLARSDINVSLKETIEETIENTEAGMFFMLSRN